MVSLVTAELQRCDSKTILHTISFVEHLYDYSPTPKCDDEKMTRQWTKECVLYARGHASVGPTYCGSVLGSQQAKPASSAPWCSWVRNVLGSRGRGVGFDVGVAMGMRVRGPVPLVMHGLGVLGVEDDATAWCWVGASGRSVVLVNQLLRRYYSKTLLCQ